MKKVYTEADEARINAVLKEIQASIPEAWKKTVVVSQKISPTVEKVMLEALKSDTIDGEKKKQIQHVLDSGMISKEVPMENKKVSVQIENFVNRQINKAIKEGRLPPKSHIQYLPSMLKITNEQTN